MIGAAGVSAVPMAARVVQKLSLIHIQSTINSKYGIDKNLGKKIADNIEKMVNENKINLTVEDIQDNVEVLLMESNRKDVAKNYILYREKRSDIRKSKWQMDERCV